MKTLLIIAVAVLGIALYSTVAYADSFKMGYRNSLTSEYNCTQQEYQGRQQNRRLSEDCERERDTEGCEMKNRKSRFHNRRNQRNNQQQDCPYRK